MSLQSFEELFLNELADIRDAENQLGAALPKMANAVGTDELNEDFLHYAEETKAQVQRIDEIVRMLNKQLPSKTCKAMQGLIREANDVIAEEGDYAVKEAALIAAAQRIKHYEIAAYGCARTFATSLGITEAAQLLQQSLDEETAADRKLTTLAEGLVNEEALQASVRPIE